MCHTVTLPSAEECVAIDSINYEATEKNIIHSVSPHWLHVEVIQESGAEAEEQRWVSYSCCPWIGLYLISYRGVSEHLLIVPRWWWWCWWGCMEKVLPLLFSVWSHLKKLISWKEIHGESGRSNDTKTDKCTKMPFNSLLFSYFPLKENPTW